MGKEGRVRANAGMNGWGSNPCKKKKNEVEWRAFVGTTADALTDTDGRSESANGPRTLATPVVVSSGIQIAECVRGTLPHTVTNFRTICRTCEATSCGCGQAVCLFSLSLSSTMTTNF